MIWKRAKHLCCKHVINSKVANWVYWNCQSSNIIAQVFFNPHLSQREHEGPLNIHRAFNAGIATSNKNWSLEATFSLLRENVYCEWKTENWALLFMHCSSAWRWRWADLPVLILPHGLLPLLELSHPGCFVQTPIKFCFILHLWFPTQTVNSEYKA